MSPAATLHPRSDAGFTIIEVLVAATLLLIGVFATLAILDTGTKSTAISKQRDVANAVAQELIERAQGGTYSAALNDMTDIRPASGTPGPADRMRAGVDPDLDAASTPVTPATVTSGSVPGNVAQSWSLRRKNTTYTVSYRACTLSDTYQQVQIAGPYDCSRAATNPGGTDTATSGACSIGVTSATQVDLANPATLTVRLQVLGVVGLSVCVLPDLTAAVCSLAGNSSILGPLSANLVASGGVLTGLLGGIRSNATLGVCPATQVEQGLAGAAGGIASATRVQVTVAWNDIAQRPHTLAQTAVVRRAAA